MNSSGHDRASVPPLIARVPVDVRVALIPWLLSRALVVGALAIARFIGNEVHVTGRHHVAPSQGLFSWDAAYYRDIAAHGYETVRHAGGLRFFPLVPLLSRGLGWLLFGRYGVALIVIVNLAALAFGALLHRLVMHETGDAGLARRAVWLGLLAPSAMVLVTGYAEAMLLTCSVAMFLALRTRRWELAACAGVLAGLTRPTGVLLIIPAAIEAARHLRAASRSESARRLLAVASPMIGLGLYLAWVGRVYGDWLIPLHLQNDAKLRGGWAEPIGRLVRAARDLFGGNHIGSGLHFVWGVVAIGLVVVVCRRLPMAYGAFAGVSVLVALSAHNLDSFERYALSAFPLVIAAAILTQHEDLERPVLVASGAVLLAYSVLGFLGIFIP